MQDSRDKLLKLLKLYLNLSLAAALVHHFDYFNILKYCSVVIPALF